jgi:hypothetical protein
MTAEQNTMEEPMRRGARKRRSGILSRISADSLKLVGGLVALSGGLLVLGLIAGGAFIADPGDASSIATGAFGVIGSIVGAYFGVKIGTDGTQAAIEAQQKEASKAQVFAAHLPESKATEVLGLAGLAAGAN